MAAEKHNESDSSRFHGLDGGSHVIRHAECHLHKGPAGFCLYDCIVYALGACEVRLDSFAPEALLFINLQTWDWLQDVPGGENNSCALLFGLEGNNGSHVISRTKDNDGSSLGHISTGPRVGIRVKTKSRIRLLVKMKTEGSNYIITLILMS